MYRWILRRCILTAGLIANLITVVPSAAQPSQPTAPGSAPIQIARRDPQGRMSSRATSTPTPFRIDAKLDEPAYTGAFLQYNSSSRRASTNVRLRWEYRPGSELFVVYNDERDTLLQRFPALQNRAFIVKATRLFRFRLGLYRPRKSSVLGTKSSWNWNTPPCPESG